MKALRIIFAAVLVSALIAVASDAQVTIYRPSANRELAFEANATTLINGRAGSIIFFDTLEIPAEALFGYTDYFQVGYLPDAAADSNKINMRFDVDRLVCILKLDTLKDGYGVAGTSYDSVGVDSAFFEGKIFGDSTWTILSADSSNYFLGSALSSPLWNTWRDGPLKGPIASVARTCAWAYPLAIRFPGKYRIGIRSHGAVLEALKVYVYVVMVN